MREEEEGRAERRGLAEGLPLVLARDPKLVRDASTGAAFPVEVNPVEA